MLLLIIALKIKSTVTVQYFCSSVLVNEVRWNITMELLSQYVSSSSQSETSDDELQPAKVRSVYLITYSQADLSIFPNRQLFADAVCEAVLNCEGSKTKVIQWTCCQENHKRQGKHYQMVIKLNKIKRWLPIWQYLKNKRSVYVHFSNRHTTAILHGCTLPKKMKISSSLLAIQTWATQVHLEQWPQVRRE